MCSGAQAGEKIPFTPWNGQKNQEQWIPASDTRLLWGGRVWFENGSAWFDWPGIYVQCRIKSSSWSVVIEGRNLFDLWVDGAWVGILEASDAPRRFDLHWPDSAARVIRLAKRSESQTHASRLFAFILPQSAQLLDLSPQQPQRRIEFIGDSYTVGFGNEASVQVPPPDQEDSLLLWTTNTNKSFGALVANRLGAQYQINAFSGRGLVRNFNGINPGLEYPFFYPHTLISAAQTPGETPKLWDFRSWHPQVIVICLGINDFQGDPPYADSALWIKTYRQLLHQLRSFHPGVRFILGATAIHPHNDLIPKVREVIRQEQQDGFRDIEYFEFSAERTGLWWHPNQADHQAIAQALLPLVTKAGGWLRR